MSNHQRILILLILALASILSSAGQRLIMGAPMVRANYNDNSRVPSDSVLIEGRVVESIGKNDLIKAFLVPIDSEGNSGDTIRAIPRLNYVSMNLHKTHAYVRFITGRKDSTYLFEIGCPGYQTQTMSYRVEHLGKRERRREMPMTMLERTPIELNEVKVVASKVKFYHRGDTLVYNADAFQLAEGSMLDQLIRQLPGVELNKDGEIKVNGEKVETLLLNGKHFFSNDRKIMLENLGAYTVDNVQVYRGQTALEKWIGDPNAEKHLTMDVKLKKEYSRGYIMNAQAGGGTQERYIGNLFASQFTNSAHLSLVGNINNVGDYSGLSGANDSWSPSTSSSDDSRKRMLGLNYDIETNDFKRTANGSLTYSGDRNLSINNGSGTTYYTDNQVFNYRYARSMGHIKNVRTSHSMMFVVDRVNISANVDGNYSSNDGMSSSLSANFSEEQANVTQETLENIYGYGSVSALAALVNRNRNISEHDSKNANGNFNTIVHYKIPGTSDMIAFTVSGNYSSSKSTSWNDYNIDFGDRTKPSDRRRQYNDNSPNHKLSLSGSCNYAARIGKVSLGITYRYNFDDDKTDSYLYELQQLADMGEYGVLPPDYLSAFSPANSYMSRQWTNTHTITPSLVYSLKCNGDKRLSVSAYPSFTFTSRHLDYWRDNRSYNIRHNSSLREAFGGNIILGYRPTAIMSDKGSNHSFSYMFSMHSVLPSMMSLVDITDESNPLYIREGNPDLKAACMYMHNFTWGCGKRLRNNLNINYSYSVNNFTQSSVYDMTTGITRTRAENINGNNSLTLHDNILWSFGKRQQFTLSAITGVIRNHSVDLMSTNGAEPVKNSAETWTVSENLELRWQINGKHSISAKCYANNRRTNSNREGFNKINAFNINYGLDGTVKLPAGFGIDTNFSLYTRRGYDAKEFDTTDAMWNAKVSYITKNKKWLFMIYAYDILHQVSNVHYSVTGTGRSVSYTNSLPHYVLATIQYRFNHQPRNKR